MSKLGTLFECNRCQIESIRSPASWWGWTEVVVGSQRLHLCGNCTKKIGIVYTKAGRFEFMGAIAEGLDDE